MNRHVPHKQSGFVMLAVVLAITVLAAIAFALNNQGASQVNAAAGEVQRDQLRYVAEAGMAHAKLQLSQNTSCSGYTDVPKTDFGVDSYSATFSANKDSPVTVTATGSLASGIEHSLINSTVRAYQPAVALALQLGKTAGKDTLIDRFYDIQNYGVVDDLIVSSNPSWMRRSLLEFDLSAIPAGVRIISAKLELQQRIVGSPGVIGVHRVTRSWEEGTGKGTGNADGASWLEYDGNNSWSQPGGDFASTLYAAATTNSGKNGQWVAWDIRDLVDEWVSGQSPNYGLMLVGDGVVDNAEFQSREEPDPAAAPKLTIAYACECGKTCGVAPSGKNVLLIVGNDTTLASKDVGYKALMESWGHTVAVIDDGASQADYDTAMAAADVIYASGSAVGSSMLDKATYTTKGMVNEVNGKIDNFGFSSSTSATANFDTFSATNAAHYITEPFAGSSVTVFTSSLTNPVPGGTLAPDLQNVGEVSGTLALVTLETGATRYDSNPSQGRRAHLPFTSAETTDMTADGKTILQRAIEWGAIDSSAPYAHWKLDDGVGTTAIDSEGGHDGTLTNDPVWVGGRLGDALDFDGVNDYVAAGTFDVSGSGLTMMAWFKAETIPTSDGRFISKASGPNDFDAWWQMSTTDVGADRYVRMRIKAGGTTTTFRDSSVKLTTGQWYFAVATYDNSGAMKLYLDGIEVASGNHAVGGPVDASPTVPVAIGANGTAERFFDGVLDDVRVYSRALGAAEIAELYADGVPGPIAHWKLDDGTGTMAVDSEGGHDGTLTNGPVWVAGQLGDALAFDGSDDYVDLTSDAPLDDVFVGGATVMAWIYPTGWGENGYGRVFDKSSSASSTGDGWVIRMNVDNGGIINFGQGFASGRGWWRIPNSSINLNTWQHIAVTYDASSTANDPVIYLNGSPLSVTEVDTPSGGIRSDSSINLRLGNFAGGTTLTFDGNIDDARIYDRMLAATEIADLYTAGGGGGGGGGPAPVFESFEEYRDADNSSSAISVAKPAGTAAGDLLVAVVVTNRNNEATLVADDAGWNLLTVDRQASSSTTGVWWKLAGGSEPASYGFSWDAANPGRSYSWIMRFSGNDPTNPIDVWDKFGECCTNSPLVPAVTTTVDDTLILRIGGFDDDDITIGDPGMAGHTPITMQESNSGTGTVSGGAAYVEQTASGDSGTANFTLTNTEQSRTITIGIAPAP